MSFDRITETLIRKRLGDLPLRITLWNGHSFSLARKPSVTLQIPSPLSLRYLLRPSFLSLGEAYVEGKLRIEGSASDIVRMIHTLNNSVHGGRPPRRWSPRPRGKKQDAKAIQHHYDVSNEFYGLWLDRHRVYSCGYFKSGSESIDQAQEQKMDYICRKLMLRPNERFLDIGCGWGGLALWAAKNYGVRATGITLSRKQYEYARELVHEEKLERRCEILLCDYRDLKATAPFDKVASIGMFEHVGLAQLDQYFGSVHELMREDGLFLNHGICSSETEPAYVAGDGGDFIERYVFPYHELPHVSRASLEMSRKNFELTDIEALRPHYSLTLRHWLERLEKNRKEAEKIAGDRRYRIWRAYLAGAAYAFDRGWISVYQTLGIKRSQQGTWPLPRTRAHLYDERRASAAPRRRPPRSPSRDLRPSRLGAGGR